MFDVPNKNSSFFLLKRSKGGVSETLKGKKILRKKGSEVQIQAYFSLDFGEIKRDCPLSRPLCVFVQISAKVFRKLSVVSVVKKQRKRGNKRAARLRRETERVEDK
jgi:hypothetical protein